MGKNWVLLVSHLDTHIRSTSSLNGVKGVEEEVINKRGRLKSWHMRQCWHYFRVA